MRSSQDEAAWSMDQSPSGRVYLPMTIISESQCAVIRMWLYGPWISLPV